MACHDEFAVSVIVPLYNGVRYLGEALASILRQTHLPCEIVVVDDGSTDESAALIHDLASTAAVPIHYVYQANQGAGAARNRGVAAASGGLLAFLDQDDIWQPQKLARQLELLRGSPQAGYSITQYELHLDPGSALPAWVRPERLQGPQRGFLPSCLVVRRPTFAAVGLFDPTLAAGNDTDWFARVNDAGVMAAVVPEVLVLHRVHTDNQSRFVKANRQDIYAVLRKSLLRKRALNER